MSVEERERLDRMEQHQRLLKEDMSIMRNDISQIKTAIIGNPLSEDKGLVGRIKEMEVTMEKQEEQIEQLKVDRIKNSVYMKIITWIAGAAGSAFILYLINQMLKQ